MHLTNKKRLLVFGLVCLVLTLLAPLAVSVFATEPEAAAAAVTVSEEEYAPFLLKHKVYF